MVSRSESCYENIGGLIRKERIKQGIELDMLSKGLMTKGNLCRIENGKREADTSIIKRLTDRLGMGFEDEGTYMFYDDYEEWKTKWKIIYSIECKNMCEAERLLDIYKEIYSQNAVRKQFEKMMRIQCKTVCIENKNIADITDILQMYKEALELTIPVMSMKNLDEMYLSIEELNIVLECRYCSMQITDVKNNKEIEYINLLEEVLKYLDKSRLSISAKAKLYPKTVVYMYRYIIKDNKEIDVKNVSTKLIDKMYEFCEKALGMLLEAGMRYYLTEILEIRIILIEAGYGGKDRDDLLRQTKEWQNAIRALCIEYGISQYTEDSCYFYKENSVYNIGKVVNTRRTMLGMTMKQLYSGICSEKTLRNLEHNRASTHRDIAEELLTKLGLPSGYQRMGIITGRRKSIELYTKWKQKCREFKYAECREIMCELEKQLPSNMVNRQFIEWGKALTSYELGELNYKTFIEIMCKALNNTMNVDKVLNADSIYISNNEKKIIYQIAAKYKYNGDEKMAYKYMKLICKQLIKYSDIEIMENIRDCEIYMTFFASILGSIGDYNNSEAVSKTVIRAQLEYGRIGEIHCNLSSIAWNKYKIDQDKKAYNDRLYQCMLWSQMCKDTFFEDRYRMRMS